MKLISFICLAHVVSGNWFIIAQDTLLSKKVIDYLKKPITSDTDRKPFKYG